MLIEIFIRCKALFVTLFLSATYLLYLQLFHSMQFLIQTIIYAIGWLFLNCICTTHYVTRFCYHKNKVSYCVNFKFWGRYRMTGISSRQRYCAFLPFYRPSISYNILRSIVHLFFH